MDGEVVFLLLIQLDKSTMEKSSAQPMDIPDKPSSPESNPMARSQQEAANVFDEIVGRSVEKELHSGISHPSIFRKGTLIEIPDAPTGRDQHPKEETNTHAQVNRRQSRRGRDARMKRRKVAICIKNEEQAEHVIGWTLKNELMLERDSVILVHVRQAANGIVGDLTTSNNSKETTERDKSHGLLRKHAIPIKQEGFNVKGVSIRGVDIRGELVRKLIELKSDLVIIGHNTTKTIKERIIGCKVSYLTSNSPCPVLVINANLKPEDVVSTGSTAIDGSSG